jgi:flagellar basal body-associated protein FliL
MVATGKGVAIAIGIIMVLGACGGCFACFWWLRRRRRAHAEEEIPLNALDDEDAIPQVVPRPEV